MELDTDLGIDSIKRVEIFSLLQEKLPDAPTVKAEHLGTLRTIRQVIDFIASGPSGHEAVPAAARNAQAEAIAGPSQQSAVNGQSVKDAEEIDRLVPCVVEWDEPTPRVAIALAADAGIWITSDGGALAERIVRRLELLGCRAKLVAMQDVLSLPGLGALPGW